MTKSQGKSWRELLQEHLENAIPLQQLLEERQTIHQIIWSDEFHFMDKSSQDDMITVSAHLTGKEPVMVIIDDISRLEQDHFERILKEFGVKEKKPAKPTKQPDWARHNQAPRSARRQR